MEFDRTKNAKRTIISSVLIKLLSIIIPFIMRTVIIYTLGNLYLGLNSLFSSILNTLNLAELGVGSAMVFSMYKPVKDNDVEKICALLNVYKKVYLFIGIIVSVIGLVLIPFLPRLINGEYPSDINIYILYVLQIISTVSGYFFFAYKGSLLIAYQRVDISNMILFFADTGMYLFQAISLIVFKNYYIFVVLMLLKNISYNLIISKVTKKRYPKLYAYGKIDEATKKEIGKKIRALTGHKIAEVVINSTDNILISMFIGLNMVAIYNNYYYIVNAVSGVILIVFNGMISIVGNYLISENKDNIIRLFRILNYLNALIVSICCSCLLNMFQPFISIWTGVNNLLPFELVILFVIYFYALRIRAVIALFQNAAGIWEKDLVKAYLMTIINLAIDISLIKRIGISAALISTIISMFFAYVYEVVVVHKYLLKTKAKRFVVLSIWYLGITVFSCFLSFCIINCLKLESYLLKLMVGGFVSVLISVLCFVGLTFFCKEFKESLTFIIKKILNKKIV